MRVVKFLAILAVSGVALIGLAAGIASALAPDPDDYITCAWAPCASQYDYVADDEGYDTAVARAAGVGQLASIGVLLGALMLVLPKISYRKRDSLFIFIPIYSTVFAFMVVWRLASLPNRYWSERPPSPGNQLGDRTSPPMAAPGYYPDPSSPTSMRYWDGSRWTDVSAPAPTTGATPTA